MTNRKEWLIQILWLSVPVIPWMTAGWLVHSYSAIAAGVGLYWLAGLLAPLIYFLVQRKGPGAEYGGTRALVHFFLWPAFAVLEAGIWMNVLLPMDHLWKVSPAGTAAGIFFLTWALLLLAVACDYGAVILYDRLRARKLLVQWLGCAFLIGIVPGALVAAIYAGAHLNGLMLDPFSLMMLVGEIVSVAFYLKIVLAMIVFGTFLFLTAGGTKAKRAVQVIFTAVFWLFLYFAPSILASRAAMAQGGNAGAYASLLTMLPLLSDLWMAGLSVWGGCQVTKWIFRD
jgi:hypothetical protein